MLTGMTVIDGPGVIWTQCFRGLSDGSRPMVTVRGDGVSIRNSRTLAWISSGRYWTEQSHSGRQEVIDRTKVVIINNVNSGSNDAGTVPETLFEGLYRMATAT